MRRPERLTCVLAGRAIRFGRIDERTGLVEDRGRQAVHAEVMHKRSAMKDGDLVRTLLVVMREVAWPCFAG